MDDKIYESGEIHSTDVTFRAEFLPLVPSTDKIEIVVAREGHGQPLTHDHLYFAINGKPVVRMHIVCHSDYQEGKLSIYGLNEANGRRAVYHFNK